MSGARWTPCELALKVEQMQKRREARADKLLTKAKRSLRPDNKKPVTPEHNIQKQVIQWFAWNYMEIYITGAMFAVPNGGKRCKAEAVRLKLEGVWPGVSDLILLYPKGQYHGLCIEMKNETGALSNEQGKWLLHRSLSGYATEVCHSLEQAQSAITTYMNL